MAQSSSKSPELLARYCDSLLKKRYVFKDKLLFQVSFVLKGFSIWSFILCLQKRNLMFQEELIIPNSEYKNFNRTVPKDSMEFTFLFLKRRGKIIKDRRPLFLYRKLNSIFLVKQKVFYVLFFPPQIWVVLHIAKSSCTFPFSIKILVLLLLLFLCHLSSGQRLRRIKTAF